MELLMITWVPHEMGVFNSQTIEVAADGVFCQCKSHVM